MNKFVKIVLVLLAVIFVGICGLLTYAVFGSNTRVTEEISYYQALSGEISGAAALNLRDEETDIPCPYDLPLLCELEPYNDYRFNYTAKRESIFQSNAYILIVSFDPENYEAQKTFVEEKYVFCTENSEGFSDGIMTEYEYVMDDFTIRAVEGGEYPKEMLFIGTSDARQEIAIIYFYNQDLDCIDDPLGKFFCEETGWDEVV